MQFKQGADVLTASNQPIGRIDWVVIDPRTKEITDVVVRKGRLFTEDKVVPVNLIAASEGDQVTLREDAGDLEALPHFEEASYLPAPDDQVEDASSVMWYPPVGAAQEPPGFPATYRQEIRRNIPEGSIPLKDGARVMSADDRDVGAVEQVLTDPEADRVTHLVVSQGLLAQEHKLVPMLWVAAITEDAVHLAVPSSVLERLPEYQG